MAQDGEINGAESNFAELITSAVVLAQVPPKKHSCISIRNHERQAKPWKRQIFSLKSGVCYFLRGETLCGYCKMCVRKTTAHRIWGKHQGSDQKQKNSYAHYTLLLYDALKARYTGSLPQFMVMCRGKWMLFLVFQAYFPELVFLHHPSLYLLGVGCCYWPHSAQKNSERQIDHFWHALKMAGGILAFLF